MAVNELASTGLSSLTFSMRDRITRSQETCTVTCIETQVHFTQSQAANARTIAALDCSPTTHTPPVPYRKPLSNKEAKIVDVFVKPDINQPSCHEEYIKRGLYVI